MKVLHTADLHLRNDRPIARVDEDWLETQRQMLRFLVDTSNKYDIPVSIGGDLFNTAIVPVRISNLFLSEMRACRNTIYVMGGNHSLLNHQEELLDDSSVGLLQYVCGNIVYLPSEEHRTEGRFEHVAELDKEMLLIHTLCFETEEEIPYGSNATHAKALLDKYPDYKYLLLGDNHTSFKYEKDGRYVINPGTPIIQNASLIGYDPKIYLVADMVAPYFVPSDPEMITSNHLEIQKERNERIENFISTVKADGRVSLSFEDNLKEAMRSAPIEVQEIIHSIFKESIHG